MLKSIALWFMLLGSTSTYSQVNNLTDAGFEHDPEKWLQNNKLRNFNSEEGKVGSRYLIKDWSPGSIETWTGQIIPNIELKFDILNHLLIANNPDYPVVVNDT